MKNSGEREKFMQLTITIKSEQNITLPINYHHIQQSALYSLSGDGDGKTSALHDGGSEYLKRVYKLFTFGPFTGKYTVAGKQIVFHNGIQFEVRSVNYEMLENIEKNVHQFGLRLGDVSYHNVFTQKTETRFETGQMKIRMCSPICVYRTLDSGYTNYWNPSDEEFYEAVSDNFRRKYEAATGSAPESGISLCSERVTEKDKYLTKYKDIYIEAWKGIYILTGRPEYLNFLYDCGLGSKNSQGFGMFEVL
jgi:CRISPR-associated endoribonuclease Cas6